MARLFAQYLAFITMEIGPIAFVGSKICQRLNKRRKIAKDCRNFVKSGRTGCWRPKLGRKFPFGRFLTSQTYNVTERICFTTDPKFSSFERYTQEYELMLALSNSVCCQCLRGSKWKNQS